MFKFFLHLLGRNPDLPFLQDVENPVHGQNAKNRHHQKVLFDANQGFWVMPQNFTDKPAVTVTKGRR